ncbi:50S ribosomal protein L16 [Candidatus Amesbacteria bacterium RIFCSPLOWO2_02_FULL_48_11]|uniref:Large ribosomal subunit protein uL16 n=6 Tax=Microgenomates group TaxID=1794810 RepID=A0A0H4T5E2_9BACT|nr:50S ribosomal protein L16, large subunit ribosomal protein L16 [uncultured Microgenomates bacterium Rifle_16ft_4_minimus_21028]KKU56907.1 MAG: 50S ribosomal protein L16 [Candidatus Amesbacteria bacterium GW2011_GWA2_47_11]KKU94856.1 MAG: 50S ribosomal protein L16 [Candidatus Amesbacteria bacterium GW2011_GWC1_48_10]KKW01044.1 MAG: 50S ribosomal protein L16 [Candidatus Amesbacteria bacterium GW2011_GWA1_48_9]OGC89624.1 MAG: 50S ribosomal protein L16 [Candidatus Amesbacteria bacterium RBG_19FT
MLQPKKQKYRKQFRGQMPGLSRRGAEVNFGEYGLKALGRGWLSARQIEAARKAISRHAHRGGKVWIRVFPDKPITKKALGTRMGSGKGDIHEYVSVVTPGRILFEIAGVTSEVAAVAFRRAAAKLPFKVKLVAR